MNVIESDTFLLDNRDKTPIIRIMPQPAAVPGNESTQETGVPPELSDELKKAITLDLQELHQVLRPESAAEPALYGNSPEQRG